MKRKIAYVLIGFLLAASALVSYLPGFKAGFQFDDMRGIVNNQHIRINSLKPASLFSAAFQDFRQNRPLSNLSFALNFYFNRENTFGYHLVNFILHVISGFCVFLLLERILARKRAGWEHARLAALLAALLWLVHPINTQAVTYIIQRHTSMAGCFFLLSLLCYDFGRAKKQAWLYGLSAGFGFSAMICKESALVLPVFILLYDLWFFQEWKSGWMKRSWKWAAAVAAFYFLVAGLVLAGPTTGKIRSDIAKDPFDISERILTQPRVLLEYMSLIIFPADSRLSLEHDLELSTSIFHPAATLPAFIAVISLVAFAFIRARKYPLLSFSILWYFGQLLIEALPLPVEIMNEHRVYLASIPILAAIPFALALPGKNQKTGMTLTWVICLLFGILTFERNKVWQNPLSLWRDSAMKSLRKSRPWNNYCSALVEAGQFRSAGNACAIALNLDPKDVDAVSNLGLYFLAANAFQEAENQFLRAIELNPDYGFAYYDLGLAKAAQEDRKTAELYFEKTMQMKIPNADIYYKMGGVYERWRQPEKALNAYEMAVALRPEWPAAKAKAAAILAGLGRCREAMELVRESRIQDPSFAGIISSCAGK